MYGWMIMLDSLSLSISELVCDVFPMSFDTLYITLTVNYFYGIVMATMSILYPLI